MKITNVTLAGIILIITSTGIVEVNGQYSHKVQKDSKGFYLYGGLNWKYIKGDRLVIPNPNLPDPVHTNTDSILFYDCLSPHIGSHYNFEIIKSLNLRVGLELNLRKYHYRLYPDSISKVYYPVWEDVRYKYNYYNIELPAEIAYNIQRFGFGVGAKFVLWELRVKKSYLNDEIYRKYYKQHLWCNSLQDKSLYPNVFLEYQIHQSSKFPLWLKAAYEYGGEYSSTVFLSLKTKL